MRGNRSPQAGAFRRPKYLPTQIEIDDARAELLRERRRIRDILVVEYSWEELQIIAANMRREMQRRREIEEMFDALGGADRVEQAFFDVYAWQLGQQRERRRGRPPPARSIAVMDEIRRRRRDYHKRVIADPIRCAELRIRQRAQRARFYAKHPAKALENAERWRAFGLRWRKTPQGRAYFAQYARDRRDKLRGQSAGTATCKGCSKTFAVDAYRRKRGRDRVCSRACSGRARANGHLIELNGQRRTLTEWAKRAGLKLPTVHNRIHKLGWDLRRALETPLCAPRPPQRKAA